jgi:hypothetical protein
MMLGAVAFAFLRRSLAREALAISSCAPGEEVEIIGRGRVRPKPLPTYSLEDVARARQSARRP